MAIRSPSKFLSIEFLKKLQSEYYVSERGKEYCAEEVDFLLNEKLCAYALRREAEYMKELSRLAREAEIADQNNVTIGAVSEIKTGGQMETKTEEATVLSIVDKLNKKKEDEAANSRLKCSGEHDDGTKCGYVVASEDDWEIGLSKDPDAKNPTGMQDSGIYVCPECGSLQDYTALDGMIKYDPATGNLDANIPGFVVDELADMDNEQSGFYFNVGHALTNAIRMDFIKRYGKSAIEKCFPGEREYLMEKLKKWAVKNG